MRTKTRRQSSSRSPNGKITRGKFNWRDLALEYVNPNQAQILMHMQKHRNGHHSPVRISELFGWTLGSTAYHIRRLHEAGLIKLAREERVRGAVEHIYRLP